MLKLHLFHDPGQVWLLLSVKFSGDFKISAFYLSVTEPPSLGVVLCETLKARFALLEEMH